MTKTEIIELDAILAAHHANGSQLKWDQYRRDHRWLTDANIANYRNRLVALGLISIVKPPKQVKPSGDVDCITALTASGCLTTSVKKNMKDQKTLHSGAVSKTWRDKNWWFGFLLGLASGNIISLVAWLISTHG